MERGLFIHTYTQKDHWNNLLDIESSPQYELYHYSRLKKQMQLVLIITAILLLLLYLIIGYLVISLLQMQSPFFFQSTSWNFEHIAHWAIFYSLLLEVLSYFGFPQHCTCLIILTHWAFFSIVFLGFFMVIKPKNCRLKYKLQSGGVK